MDLQTGKLFVTDGGGLRGEVMEIMIKCFKKFCSEEEQSMEAKETVG